MNRMRGLWGAAVLLAAVMPAGSRAVSSVGFQGYVAASDALSGGARVYGQLIVHQGYDLSLSETIKKVPVLSLQYGGLDYRQGPPAEPNYVEARARSVAERLVQAWSLMDHGARLEIGDDDWNAYRVPPRPTARKYTAVFIRSPVGGYEPLRILTIYPQDLAGCPWIANERSLAEYWMSMIQAHYLLFWRNETNLTRYRELRLDRTQEGQIFRVIASQAIDLARRKRLERLDANTVKEVLADMTLTQRETLYRLAIVPPMDWESSARSVEPQVAGEHHA
jgi:hypothetical protein